MTEDLIAYQFDGSAGHTLDCGMVLEDRALPSSHDGGPRSDNRRRICSLLSGWSRHDAPYGFVMPV